MMGTTKIVWDDVFEEYKCERCEAILYYSLGFRFCPYCRRRIIHTDDRRAVAFRGTGGVVIR